MTPLLLMYTCMLPWTRNAPLKSVPWDSHGNWTSEKAIRTAEQPHCIALDLLLQCSHWKSLYNSLGRLCCNLNFLAKNVPHAGLSCWLHPGLDAAQTWNCEHTCLFHLLRGNFNQVVEHLCALLCLQAMLISNCFQEGSLAHRLCRNLHRLHWRHGEGEDVSRKGQVTRRYVGLD